MKKRVVITGMGILSSIGDTVEEFTSSLYNGVSGLKPIPAERFSTESRVYRNRNAHVIRQDLFSSLLADDETVLREASVRAIRQAITDAGLDMNTINKRSLGLCLGTSVGSNFPFMRWVNEFLKDSSAMQTLITTPTIAGAVAKTFGVLGPVSTISTACAAGTNSIGRACDFISNDRAEYMIAGGIDIFTDHSFSGFNSLTAISKSDCKPFDNNRDGMMLGDASAYFIMEEYEHAINRGARIHAEVLGYSTLNEAYHATAPTPDGSMAYRVMNEAIAYSGIQPHEIEYINAHGTATKANDEMEFVAIKRFVKDNPVYISSTKSLTGHTLGAAGSIELMATIVGMQNNFIPPSLNVSSPIEQEDCGNMIFVKDKGLQKEFSTAISNSFGFAGNMASIVVRKINHHNN